MPESSPVSAHFRVYHVWIARKFIEKLGLKIPMIRNLIYITGKIPRENFPTALVEQYTPPKHRLA